MTTINAFNPKYIETHAPQFLSSIRKESKQIEDGKFHATKSRSVRQSTQELISKGIDTFTKIKKSER